mmetsp:Transcript_9668/g.32768  ORF Transcript_9668/g.32768 Transcript_9668/m.32768 type:complete len:316 (+) Transcript_9668:2379-3326(+)
MPTALQTTRSRAHLGHLRRRRQERERMPGPCKQAPLACASARKAVKDHAVLEEPMGRGHELDAIDHRGAAERRGEGAPLGREVVRGVRGRPRTRGRGLPQGQGGHGGGCPGGGNSRATPAPRGGREGGARRAPDERESLAVLEARCAHKMLILVPQVGVEARQDVGERRIEDLRPFLRGWAEGRKRRTSALGALRASEDGGELPGLAVGAVIDALGAVNCRTRRGEVVGAPMEQPGRCDCRRGRTGHPSRRLAPCCHVPAESHAEVLDNKVRLLRSQIKRLEEAQHCGDADGLRRDVARGAAAGEGCGRDDGGHG